MGPSLKFQRDNRITKRPEFLLCYSKGRKHHSKHFILFVLARQDEGGPVRFGSAVGKKIGNAVARNRLKRLFREFFRRRRETTPSGLSIVAIPKRGLDVKAIDLDSLTRELGPLLDRAQKRAARERGCVQPSGQGLDGQGCGRKRAPDPSAEIPGKTAGT